MYNPRFPHVLSVRNAKMDSNGDLVTDAEGHVVYEDVPLEKVVMIDNEPMLDAEGNYVTETVMSIEFGYRTSSENTRQMGEVVYSDYKVGTPLFLTPISYGQRIFVQDYDRTFEATVVKKTSYNIGSIVWFNEVQN